MRKILLASLLGFLMSNTNSRAATLLLPGSGYKPVASITAAPTDDTEPPTVPVGLEASNINETSFTLQWTASTDNINVFGYEVFKDDVWVGANTSPTLDINNLSCGTTYSIRVNAFDDAGNISEKSAPFLVTTTACPLDTVPPTVPTGLAASNITDSTVDLSWTASTDNVSIHGYQVYKNEGWYNGTTDLSITVTGLNSGTTYLFSVDAFDWANPANISVQSAPISVTTSGSPPPPDTEKPSAPTGLEVSNITETTIDLKWNPSTDNVHVFGYEIYRNGNWAGATIDTFLTISGLPSGTKFDITISAFDDSNNLSVPSAPLSVTTLGDPLPPDTQKPTIPTGLVAYNITQTSVSLSWNASADNIGVHGYEIYKNGGWAGATVDTFLVLKDLVKGSTFNVSVSAFDDVSNISDPCQAISVKLLGDSDTEAPSVPVGLSFTTVTETSFTLSWAAATDNVHVYGYEVFLDGIWAGATTETTLEIIDLSCGTSYEIQVNAFDDAGNISEKSSVLAVVTTDCENTAASSKSKMNMSVWPNPVSSILYMKDVPADAVISLHTADGRLISGYKAAGKVASFNVDNLNKGLYYIKVQSGSLVKIEKIIVE